MKRTIIIAALLLLPGCATTDRVTVTLTDGRPTVHVSFKPYSERKKPYMATVKQHKSIEYWSSTDVAECVSGLSDEICTRLWEINSQQGFTEEPVVEKQNWWRHLTPEQQMHINECCKEEFGE